MTPTAPLLLPDRFALVIDALRRSVAGRHRRLGGALVLLICLRLGRIAARFAALAARVGSGTLRAPRRPGHRPAPDGAAPATRAASPAGPVLPRGFAWLVRLVPEAAVHGSQLQALLAEPEMAALIAAAPEAGRLLRPLCRMLAIAPTPPMRRRSPPASSGPAAPEPSPDLPPTQRQAPRRKHPGPAPDPWPPFNRPPFPA